MNGIVNGYGNGYVERGTGTGLERLLLRLER